MAFTSQLGVKLWANIGDFVGNLTKAEHKLKEFKKRIGGRRAFVGEAAELLVGGGAIAGIGLLGHTLQTAAEKAAELRHQFDEGELTLRQMTGELARQIPVLGKFVSMWDSVQSAILGTETAQQQLADATERFAGLNQASELAKSFGRSAAMAGATKEARDELEARFELEDKLAKIRDLTAKGITTPELDAASKAAFDEFDARMRAIRQAQFEAANPAKALLEQLAEQAHTFTMSADEIAAYEVRVKGGTKAQQDWAASTVRFIEIMKAEKRALEEQADAVARTERELSDAAKSIFTETRTPFENFHDTMEGLNRLFRDGFIDLETFNRAARNAREILRGFTAPSAERPTSFIEANPSTFDFSSLRGGASTNRTQKVTDPQLQQTNKHLADIAAKVGRRQVATAS